MVIVEGPLAETTWISTKSLDLRLATVIVEEPLATVIVEEPLAETT